MYVRHSWSNRAHGLSNCEIVGKGRESTRARTKKGNAWQKSKDWARNPSSGDIADPAFLTRAFDGRAGGYFMVTPNPSSNDYRGHQRANMEAVRRRLEATRVRYFVAFEQDLARNKESDTGPVSRS